MKCPVCNIDLLMSERQGVEIDYCPQCRGVWLDRGELDKIIEKSGGPDPSDFGGGGRREGPRDGHGDHNEGHKRDDRDYGHDDSGHGRKRKGSLLGQLFDLGGD